MADTKSKSLFGAIESSWPKTPTRELSQSLATALSRYVRMVLRRRYRALPIEELDDIRQSLLMDVVENFEKLSVGYRPSEGPAYLNTLIYNAVREYIRSKSTQSPTVQFYYSYLDIHPLRYPVQPIVVIEARDEQRRFLRTVIASIKTFRFPRYRARYRAILKEWLRSGHEEKVGDMPDIVFWSAVYQMRKISDSFREYLYGRDRSYG